MNTIGTVVVAALATAATCSPAVAITATWRRTRSAAISSGFMYGHSRSQKSGAGMVGECIGVAYVTRQNVDALVPRDRTHLEN
jgi:hypothetical protein